MNCCDAIDQAIASLQRGGYSFGDRKTPQLAEEGHTTIAKLLGKSKYPLAQKIMQLPPQRRIEFIKRLEAWGRLIV